jgi:hypothetical protein
VFLGLVGVYAIIAVEFAFGEGRFPRMLSSPTRFFVFVLYCTGFLLVSIVGARNLDLIPDLANVYYSLNGELQDIAAVSYRLLPLDPDSWFLNGGTGLYALFFSIEALRARSVPIWLGLWGLLLAAILVLVLVLNLMDRGTAAGMVTLLLTVIVAPAWFVGMGFAVRRSNREKADMG